MVYHFANIAVIICLCYSCILWFIYKSKQTMTLSGTSLRSGTKNIQAQMTRTIYLQVCAQVHIL